METCAARMKRPAKSTSASSFEKNTMRLEIGSGARTRKSVSSGDSDWLTSSVANATTSIGSAITRVSSPRTASLYGPRFVKISDRAVYLPMYIRTRSKPDVSIKATMPINTRRNASNPESDRTPTSNSPRKKWAVSRHQGCPRAWIGCS